MAKRTGVPSLQKVAMKMCKLLAKFTPIITRLYPENDTLIAALATANAACALLAAQLELVRDYGD